jgi:hypothetical protein
VPILPIALGYTAGLKRPNQTVLLRWVMFAVQSLLLTGHGLRYFKEFQVLR